MHRVLKKDQILTIPNLLSVVRLALIPLIVWLYCGAQQYDIAVAVILLSGMTDVVDGYIARHWHMVSDFGKILDPMADKLTQAAIILCLLTKYPLMRWLIIFFVIKEMMMVIMGLLVIKKTDAVNSAKWYGKVNTVVLYAVMMLLILFPSLPDTVVNLLIVTCVCVIVASLGLYMRFYMKLLFEKKK